jgi:hypothetical protein
MTTGFTTTSPAASLIHEDGETSRCVVRYIYRTADPLDIELRILRVDDPVLSLTLNRGGFANAVEGVDAYRELFRFGDMLIAATPCGLLVAKVDAALDLLRQIAEHEDVDAVIAACLRTGWAS